MYYLLIFFFFILNSYGQCWVITFNKYKNEETKYKFPGEIKFDYLASKEK